jgi:hypothetical protein
MHLEINAVQSALILRIVIVLDEVNFMIEPAQIVQSI